MAAAAAGAATEAAAAITPKTTEARPAAGVPSYDEGMNVQPRMVLLVEDEDTITVPLTEALAREGFRTEAAGPQQIGGLELDPSARTVTLDGEPLELTRKEFDLLALLMGQAGTVVSRERLIDEVWDVNWFGSTKTLDVHVSGLRKKLGDDSSDPRYLHTVRGVGFRFASSVESDAP
jgi:DNA-binding response OmpR family regulator